MDFSSIRIYSICIQEQQSLIPITPGSDCHRSATSVWAHDRLGGWGGAYFSSRSSWRDAESTQDEFGASLSPSWRPEGGEEPTNPTNAHPSNATHRRDLRRWEKQLCPQLCPVFLSGFFNKCIHGNTGVAHLFCPPWFLIGSRWVTNRSLVHMSDIKVHLFHSNGL